MWTVALYWQIVKAKPGGKECGEVEGGVELGRCRSIESQNWRVARVYVFYQNPAEARLTPKPPLDRVPLQQ
jgi:hypothetical protein